MDIDYVEKNGINPSQTLFKKNSTKLAIQGVMLSFPKMENVICSVDSRQNLLK